MTTRLLTGAASAALLLLTGMPLLHEAWWVFELPAHFRPHLAFSAALLGMLSIFLRLWLASAMSAVAAIAALAFLAAPPAAPAEGAAGLRIVSQNLGSWNRERGRAVAMLDREDADVVMLQEYTPGWHRSLAGIRRRYEHVVLLPKSGSFGIALYSKVPITGSTLLFLGRTETPFIAAEIESHPFSGFMIAVHFQPPMSAFRSSDRNRQLSELAAYLQALERPFIVVGDFNNTPWSPSLAEFLAGTNGRVAYPAWLATWPAPLGPVGIPIDLAVGSESVLFGERSLVPAVGSDHRGTRFTVVANAAQ